MQVTHVQFIPGGAAHGVQGGRARAILAAMAE